MRQIFILEQPVLTTLARTCQFCHLSSVTVIKTDIYGQQHYNNFKKKATSSTITHLQRSPFNKCASICHNMLRHGRLHLDSGEKRRIGHELSREDTIVPLVSRNLLTFWWVKMAARWSSENVVVEFRDAQVHSHYTCTHALSALEV